MTLKVTQGYRIAAIR